MLVTVEVTLKAGGKLLGGFRGKGETGESTAESLVSNFFELVGESGSVNERTAERICFLVLSVGESVGRGNPVGGFWLRKVTWVVFQSMSGLVVASHGIPSTIFAEGWSLVTRNVSSCSSPEGRLTLSETLWVMAPAEVGCPSNSSRRIGVSRGDS